MTLDEIPLPDTTRTRLVSAAARISLGLVWLYEGLVPKLLWVREDQLDLVSRSGLVLEDPRFTLLILGYAQVALGLWLLLGIAQRAAVLLATGAMLVLIVLVAKGNPWMLTDPYGALVKDLCLIACAATVWILAPVPQKRATGPIPARRGL